MARLPITDVTLKRLFAVSGNQCAYPNCGRELVDAHGNIFAQICHIEAAAPKGERFNHDSNDEYRRSYENLILMCYDHHVVTDNVRLYPVDKLKQFKAEHEAKFMSKNFTVTENTIKDVLKKHELNINIENNIINTTNLPERVVERLLKDLDKAEIELAEKEIKFKEMERQYKDAVARLKEESSSSQDDEAELLSKLYEEGKFDEVEQFLEKRIEEDHSKIALRYIKLGSLKFMQLRYSEATEFYLKAVELEPDNIQLLNEIALLYRELDRQDDALNFFSKAFTLTQAQPNINDNQLLFYYAQIGNLHVSKSEIAEAENILEKGLAILSKSDDVDSLSASVLYNSVAHLAEEKGDYKTAIEFLELGVTLCNRHLNIPIFYNTIGAYHNNLCNAYSAYGDYTKSLFHGYKALDIAMKIALKGPGVGLAKINIGRTFFSRGDFDSALHYLNEGLSILISIYGEKHGAVCAAYNSIGQVYIETGLWNKAVASLEKAEFFMDMVTSKERLLHSMVLANLGSAYAGLAEFDKSLFYHQQALEIDLKNYGEKHHQTAMDYANLATVYFHKGEFYMYEKYQKISFTILCETLPENHYDIGMAYSSHGNVLMEKGDFRGAIFQLKEAVRILKQKLNPDHPRLLSAMETLAYCKKMT